MEIDDKIHPTLVFLVISAITILALAVILSNNSFAQTLHDRTLQVVNQTSRLDKNFQINVGNSPRTIDIFRDKVYVANHESNIISVISAENAIKIKDIEVEQDPRDIAIDQRSGKVYVANYGSDSVSVINGENAIKIKEIDVGRRPLAIGVDELQHVVYVTNSGDDSVSVIDGENDTKIGENIRVGEFPIDIRVLEEAIYVANRNSNDVSIISRENRSNVECIDVGLSPVAMGSSNGEIYVANSQGTFISVIPRERTTDAEKIPTICGEIRPIAKPIDVGKGPTAIDVDQRNQRNNTIYVANTDDNSISVIHSGRSTDAKKIPVGKGPTVINVDQSSGKVYVANTHDNSVSVIENDTKIRDIPVGNQPRGIHVDETTGTIYVANYGSDSVSLIEANMSKVVAGVTFQLNPFNSGRIKCDDRDDLDPQYDNLTPPLGELVFVSTSIECTAIPNEGFEFLSWEGNLGGGNSSKLLSFSRPVSTWDSFLEFLRIKSPDKPEATLKVTNFGAFTANFRELPPAVPSEYWIPLYGIIASTIVGWSIPGIIGWVKSKRDVRKLNYYHKQIASLYGDGKLDESDIEALDRLRSRVLDAYSQGKINEKHYESLGNEISILYEEIFRRKIDSLDNNNKTSNNKTTREQLDKIRNEVEYAYSKGKINDKHYDLLNKAISKLESKEGGGQELKL
jgi:YVTN family beta-propeller protein